MFDPMPSGSGLTVPRLGRRQIPRSRGKPAPNL